MTQRPRSGTNGQGPGLRYFATTIPGLAEVLAEQISATPGLIAEPETGNDGRADLVFFRTERGTEPALRALTISEDAFVVIAETQRTSNPHQVARDLLDARGLERALSVWSRHAKPLKAAMNVHTVTRVLSERHFRRTQLRTAVNAAVQRERPRWRIADPGELELWVLEHRPDRLVAALRLTDQTMRQRGRGRAAERHGALRPAVAAAMIRLAGDPAGELLDPFCGSGTIVTEALSAGWAASGSDIDAEAVETARRNVPNATFTEADARHLPLADQSIDAVVANLPFGKQFAVEGRRDRWLAEALTELARVTRAEGRIVLLLPPPVPRSGLPAILRIVRRIPIRLLGQPTTIWVIDRLRADKIKTWEQPEPTAGLRRATDARKPAP